MTKPYSIDIRAARLAFSRAAETYDAAAVLQQEVCSRLLSRLEYIQLDPKRIIDLGTGTGGAVEHLFRLYRKTPVLALDFAMPMVAKACRRGGWRRRPRGICADAHRLPVADAVTDLVVSNLMLQWCDPLSDCLAEVRRVLKPNGLFLFATFGPDTLKELRQAWKRVDSDVHVHTFADMHDIGDALLQAGFSEPVVDMEVITLTYPELSGLLKDLKHIGAQSAVDARARGLLGKGAWKALQQHYEGCRLESGGLPATYEIIYGTAWVPDVPPPSLAPQVYAVQSIQRKKT